MSDEQARQPIDLNTYSPTDWDRVVPLPMPVPDRVFSPGSEVKWLASLTGSGVVVVNVVHEHYPEDMMQVQMVPRVDDNSALDTYCLHMATAEASIPNAEGDRIVNGIFLAVMQAVWGNPAA